MPHEHHFWWRFYPHKELTQVYLSSAVRGFANSIVGLFVPLYLYLELGYSLPATLSLFVFFALTLAVSSPFAAKFAAKYGCKHSILVSTPLYILFTMLLYTLPVFKVPLWLLGILAGVSIAFYWMGMHLEFSKVSDHKHRGEEVGKRDGITILGTLAGPIAGGVIIQQFGFKPAFILSSIILFISALFLFLSKDKHTHYNFHFKELWDKRHWKYSLFFISRGTRVMAAGVIWPLFVFAVLNDYFTLGALESILAAGGALLLWLSGKFSDRINKSKILHWVAPFESFSWFLRAIIATPLQALGITIFGSITYGAYESPAGALEYDRAGKNVLAYFVGREVFICVGRLLVLGMVLLTDTLTHGLVLNGFAMLAAFLF
ncbi:MFS transporter [Candidatus Woesearchaeota archaeon]|nr:MFS transporter [Candidatus Woesearchaeota archaeon]